MEVDLQSFVKTPLEGEPIPLQIHYEDGDLAVIEKPAGLVVHPGSGIRNGTIVHALLYHFQKSVEFWQAKDVPGSCIGSTSGRPGF